MNNLKKLRKDNNLTQKDVADALNIARTTYVGYELGNRDIPTDILVSLSKYYDVSVEYLLGGLNDMNISYSSLIDLIMSYNNDRLGKFLQTERQKRNMTIEDFANFLGISQIYLNMLETGSDSKSEKTISPTIDILNTISNSLGISLNQLLDICGYSENSFSILATKDNNSVSNSNNGLGIFLKNEREKRELSLREFAEFLNISHTYLSKLENGVDPRTRKPVSPTLDTLKQISSALGISLQELVEISESKDNTELNFTNKKSIFSKRLRNLRENSNLSQQELAGILNISNSAISKWEQGAREPDFETLKTIADYFGVTTDYLIGNENIIKEIPLYFNTPQEAVKFILEQPMIANFGGYNLDLMSDEEIMDMAEDVADMLRIMAKKHKK